MDLSCNGGGGNDILEEAAALLDDSAAGESMKLMENPTILVADGDPKNLQILRENLESSGFEVIVASDGMQAWQKISAGLPDLILSEVNLPQLDGFQLLEKLKADPATSAIPLMFLTNRRELQDRVRSLRGGVKDYMIKPLHVKEVLARIRMILRRMERLKDDEVETSHKLVGRLEEFSPVDLIESFGVERKTGILTLRNENNRTGEIYFREGAVVNASLGNLKAEKAVYQMLPWKHGHFTMIFKELNVADEISVSNLGLLLQGFKRMEERERLFKLLPSPETTFVTTETFRSILTKRELAPEVAKFISLIDGRHDILQLIDESTYDDIKSLERLVKLYQQGFIKPGKASAAPMEADSALSQSLAEPKIVQQIATEPEPSPQKTPWPVPEKQQTSETAPVEAKTSGTTGRPAPVVDLPSILPSVKLPPPFERSPFAGSPFSDPGEKKEEKQKTAPAPWPDKQEPPAPISPPDPPRVSEPETVARQLPELEPEPPDMEQVEGPETAVKKNGNENLWPDAGITMPAAEAGPAADEEDMIEIREADDESPAELSSTAEIDRILRTIGRGLSPEYVEPELLPLDLNELMQRPMTPPPFIKNENPAESGGAAPGMKDTTPLPLDTAAPQLPLTRKIELPERMPPAPIPEALQDTAETPRQPEEEAFSPIVELRKTQATASTSIEQIGVAQEHVPATASPFSQQETSSPALQGPDAPIAEDSPFAMPAPQETPAAPVEVKETAFAQNLYDIPREIIPEYVDVVKMEKQAAAAMPSAPPPVSEPPAAAPVPAIVPASETPAPADRPAASAWSTDISSCLLRLAGARQIVRPKLVVIGRDGFHISAIVKTLLGPESSLRKVASATFQHLELGERKVGSGQPFDIIGISIEQQFTKLLATVAKDLAAYIMLAEADRQQDLSYLGYLLNTLRSSYRVPAGVAVVRAKDQKNLSSETVRDLLNAEAEYFEECNPTDAGSVAAFLQGLTSEATLARWVNPA
jgi:CheY-like chemotaxis protein